MNRRVPNGFKAIIAAVIAVLATFGGTLATTSDVTWRTVVAALVSAVVAHQGTYWAPRNPDE